MSEGQHIEDFVASQKFINQVRCLAVVKEARQTYKAPKKNAPNIEIVGEKAPSKNLMNAAAAKNAEKDAFIAKIIKEGKAQGLTENAAKENAQAAWRRHLDASTPQQRDHKPRVPNPFPSVDASTMLTLDSLNEFINREFASFLLDEKVATIPTRKTVGDALPKFAEFTFAEYDIMFSSGNDSDCLIHTLLTATCPAFRRLPKDKKTGAKEKEALANKDTVARWVRNYVLPASKEYRAFFKDSRSEGKSGGRYGGETVGEEAQLRLFGYTREGARVRQTENFLSDTDIGLIVRIYNINLLTFEKQGGQQTVRLSTATNPTLDSPTYMFMNKSAVHFESVRTPEGSYTIPLSTAYDINTIINESVIRESIENYTEPKQIKVVANNYKIPIKSEEGLGKAKAELLMAIAAIKKRMQLPPKSTTTRGTLSFEQWLKTEEGIQALQFSTKSELKAQYKPHGGGGRQTRSKRSKSQKTRKV